jgi:preprotein translocase subunit SecD
MNNLSKIRAAFLLFLVFLGIAYAIPNFLNSSVKNTSFSFLPGKSINLGLDLKGGSYLLLKADMDIVFSEKLEILLSDIRSALRKSKIGYKKLSVNDKKISFQKRDLIPNDKIKSIILTIDENLIVTINENTFFIEFSDLNKKKIIK